MATKYREMVAAVTLTATASTALYTTPPITSAAIHAVSVVNGTAAVVQIKLYKVPASGSVGDPALIATRLVPVGGVLTLHDAINHKLEAGTQIFAVGAGLGLSISGVEYVSET